MGDKLKTQLVNVRNGGAGQHVPPAGSEALDKDILELRKKGMTQRAIAKEVGISQQAVGLRLREAGRAAGKPLTPDEIAFVRLYADEGFHVAAISEALHRYPGTVYALCRREGIEYEAGGRWTHTHHIFTSTDPGLPADKVREIVSAGRRNHTLAQVARDTELSESIVERVLQHHAPTVWRFNLKGGLSPVGKVIANTTGADVSRERTLKANGLIRDVDYDNLIVDYGAEEVQGWITDLEADHAATRRLLLELRKAMTRRTT